MDKEILLNFKYMGLAAESKDLQYRLARESELVFIYECINCNEPRMGKKEDVDILLSNRLMQCRKWRDKNVRIT